MMTVTDAQACLSELVDRVQAGEEVTLTQDGQPVAVLIRPDGHRIRRRSVRDGEHLVKHPKQEDRTQLLDEELSIEREEDLERAIRIELDKR